MITAFALVALWLSNPAAFPIKTVRVEGDYAHVSTVELQKTITPYARASFFGLQASQLKNAIQQIPWIDVANIRREFPATIVVTVMEMQPILIWNKTGLMTAEGVLFTPPVSTLPKNLPALSGPIGNEQLVFNTMQQINQGLETLNLTVKQLNLSPRGAWTLQLSNGIEVILGKQDSAARLQQLVKIYPEVVGSKVKQVVSIDLRYPNGIAVMWKH